MITSAFIGLLEISERISKFWAKKIQVITDPNCIKHGFTRNVRTLYAKMWTSLPLQNVRHMNGDKINVGLQTNRSFRMINGNIWGTKLITDAEVGTERKAGCKKRGLWEKIGKSTNKYKEKWEKIEGTGVKMKYVSLGY